METDSSPFTTSLTGTCIYMYMYIPLLLSAGLSFTCSVVVYSVVLFTSCCLLLLYVLLCCFHLVREGKCVVYIYSVHVHCTCTNFSVLCQCCRETERTVFALCWTHCEEHDLSP